MEAVVNFLTGKVGAIIAIANPTRSYSIVSFGDGEVGLYISGLVNQIGTPLACRGSRNEIESFVAKHRS